jgi:hypothetical protein
LFRLVQQLRRYRETLFVDEPASCIEIRRGQLLSRSASGLFASRSPAQRCERSVRFALPSAFGWLCPIDDGSKCCLSRGDRAILCLASRLELKRFDLRTGGGDVGNAGQMNRCVCKQRQRSVELTAFCSASCACSDSLCCARSSGLNQWVSRVERSKGRDARAQRLQSR